MARGWTWAPQDPHSGGAKIPPAVQERARLRVLAHAEKRYKGMYIRLDIRFRGPCCYIGAYQEPVVAPNWPPKDWKVSREQYIEDLRNTPVHLCRLRFFGNEDKWSLAFFTYSNEKYSPCAFPNGTFYGTPEEGLEVGATYLGTGL
jgi:hypothetical protein